MNNERIIALLNQVERNAAVIPVHACLDGKWQMVPLVDLPTHLAIQHTCAIVATILRKEDEAKTWCGRHVLRMTE